MLDRALREKKYVPESWKMGSSEAEEKMDWIQYGCSLLTGGGWARKPGKVKSGQVTMVLSAIIRMTGQRTFTGSYIYFNFNFIIALAE